MNDRIVKESPDDHCPQCKEMTGAFIFHYWTMRRILEVRECRKCGEELSSKDITDQFELDPDVDSEP